MAIQFVIVAIVATQCLVQLAAGECKAGGSAGDSAQSCQAVYKCKPGSKNGYYWLKSENNGEIKKAKLFCDFKTIMDGVSGAGWTRVAHFNATTDPCPSGLYKESDPRPMCGREDITPGCTSTTFKTFSVPYSRVCGRVLGYKTGSPDAFGYELRDIDKTYVDGLSLTHGQPRKHLWTWAADHIALTRIPPVLHFIGNDYYMEGTGGFYTNDELLWDGVGCESSGLCAKSGEPWFCRNLPVQTTDDIELRVCRNEYKSNENVGAQFVEIFIN